MNLIWSILILFQWERYMLCDGSPDLLSSSELNTYMNLWRDDKDFESFKTVLQEGENTLKVCNWSCSKHTKKCHLNSYSNCRRQPTDRRGYSRRKNDFFNKLCIEFAATSFFFIFSWKVESTLVLWVGNVIWFSHATVELSRTNSNYTHNFL